VNEGARFWRKLFGLEQEERKSGPAAHPSHSMTGEVVTGRPVDWSRYDDCMRVNVVGESHYQDALMRVSKCPPRGEHGYECGAELVLEPDNPYDKFAVKVMVDGQHVGYLPKGTAKRLGKRLRGLEAEGLHPLCMAYIGRAAEGNPNLGISLRLPYDGEILQGRR
jgi:HIRAN domain